MWPVTAHCGAAESCAAFPVCVFAVVVSVPLSWLQKAVLQAGHGPDEGHQFLILTSEFLSLNVRCVLAVELTLYVGILWYRALMKKDLSDVK